ncbi:DinB family protein [Arthrobacter sp. NPDC080082]|uniref:DinB family protein n=1 Tax=unclassified Arthrobacter TaxID=235627 RepID=UPI0034357AF9
MKTFDHTDDLHGATFTATNLRGAKFIRADLSGAVMRGVDLSGADIDAPWLAEDGSTLLLNGVDIVPLVEAELNRRFPGRAERRATDPDGLRHAWTRLEEAWEQALERAAAQPASALEVQVDGEWSFAQTLRHLVMATDTWLRKAILEIEQPYHSLGQPNAEFETDGYDLSVFAAEPPRYQEVLGARQDRQTMVRDFLAAVAPARPGRRASEPVGAGPRGHRPLLPAHHPQRGVGPPAVRPPRPRRRRTRRRRRPEHGVT